MKAAIFGAGLIGDGLLMLIAAYQLKQQGYEVTVFHPLLHTLGSWVQEFTFAPLPSVEECVDVFKGYDVIFLEAHKDPRVDKLIHARDKKVLPGLWVFYLTYALKKRPPLKMQDILFDPKKSLAENIAQASARILGLKGFEIPLKKNGLVPPAHLVYRRYDKRVVIHPTSTRLLKNWRPKRFCKLARWLKAQGFDPVFCVGPHQIGEWNYVREKGIALVAFPHLSDLADFIYESGYLIGNDSGLGHLASNLCIPHMTIACNPRVMRMWQPDWLRGCLIVPPSWLPNSKPLRLKTQYWAYFIPTRTVMKHFGKLVREQGTIKSEDYDFI